MTDQFFVVFSSLLFVCSLFFFGGSFPKKWGKGFFSLFFLVDLFLGMLWFTADYMTGRGIDDATLYHLKYGLKGAGFGDFSLLIIGVAGALALGGLILIFLLRRTPRQDDKLGRGPNFSISIILIGISLLLNPAIRNVIQLQAEGISNRKSSTSDFDQYYRKPEIKPNGKPRRNLVFIYAESLERTYFDQTVFPGLMENLSLIQESGISFSDIKQVAGTGWTIGGMIASQCGIPLYTPSHGNSMVGMDRFLSSAVCLGDLLNQEGYFLSYMGGADLGFGGKGKLFSSHGFSEVLGRGKLLQGLQDKSYKTSWGLYDDSLLDMAYDRFIQLSESGRRFGLFTLTLDTHQPEGHLSKRCEGMKYGDGTNKMLNSVACADRLISDFINRLLDSPYAENTVIVLVSDHLAMKNGATSLLNSTERRDLVLIIDPELDEGFVSPSPGSTLDTGVTLLPFLGFDGNIGLGRNLLDPGQPVEERHWIHSRIRKWKKELSAFWDFPKIRETVVIDESIRSLEIDKRSFLLPVLVEMNENLQTTLRFQFNKNNSQKTLIEQLGQLGPKEPFLLIDMCSNTSKLYPSLSGEGLCYAIGRGSKAIESGHLEGRISFSAERLRQIYNRHEQPVIKSGR